MNEMTPITDAELSAYEMYAKSWEGTEKSAASKFILKLIAALREARAEIDLLRNNHTKSFEDLALEHHKLQAERDRLAAKLAKVSSAASTFLYCDKVDQEEAADLLQRALGGGES